MSRSLHPGFARTLAAAAVWLACALPAAAQPYVYAVTGTSVFRGGVNLTTLPAPRLVTIDPVSGQAIASLSLTGCSSANGVAVRSDGSRVFVACATGSTTGAVLAIDPVAKQIVATRALAGVAGGVAITPAGDRLVVLEVFAPSVVLDATSLATIGTIAGSSDGIINFGTAHRVVASNSAAYFESFLRASGAVVVASLADFSITKTIDFGADSVADIALTGDGTRLVVAQFANKASIVNTATNAVEATIALPAAEGSGFGAAADAGTHGYVSRLAGVRAIDLATNTVTGLLGPASGGMLATSAAGDRLYVAGLTDSTVSAVNTASGAVVSSAVVKGGVNDLIVPASSPAIASDACSYALAFRPAGFAGPAPRESPAGSSGWRIDVIALPDRCTWTPQSNVPWITFEYANGTGPDNVGLTIAPNMTGAARTGIVTIGGQTLTVSQAGCSNPIIFFDRPLSTGVTVQPYKISGWAIDTCAITGTGVDDPAGTMGYARSRPDVGAAFGGQFTNSGFEFRDTFERRPGFQDVTVSFRDTVTGNMVSRTTTAYFQESIAPFGSLDTPFEGQAVSGDMALTGWVMDDVGLLGNILVYRDSLPGEGSSPGTPGKLFVGVAARVAGARPDVQALYPSYADNDRAGFGLMVLTNALPNGGNGTFTFHVQVADRYNVTWLGPRTVTVNNATSPLPFGAIDTPAPGQTVSGTIVVQGWALTPGTAMIPLDGITIDVIIDGAVVGHPTFNQARPDVQALFPSFTNAAGAGGYFFLDTRTLSNGVHTIAWVVRDNAGHAKGIGSRYFTVSN